MLKAPIWRKRFLFLSFAVLLPSGVFASDPPKNTGHATPPSWTPPARDWFDNTPVVPDPNAQADPLVLAGSGSFTLQPQFRPRKPGKTSTSSVAPFSDTVPLAGSHHFKLRANPLTVPGGSPQLIGQPFFYSTLNVAETEPYIIANNIYHADTGQTLTHHVAAFHHPATYNGSYDIWIHANYTTDATSASGLSTPALQYVPSGYTFSTDPWLSQNSFNDGIAPRRMYLSGVTATRNAQGVGVSPSAVRVWYSDTGGITWSGGWPVDSRSAGQPILDRPTSAVSDYSGTRGYYYVAYTEMGNPATLWITSSTNGVHPFCNAVPPIRCYPPQLTTAVVSNRDTPFAAQIIINPATGRLYVLYWPQTTVYGNAEIRMRRSSDWSVTNFEVDGFGNPIEYTIANGFTSTGFLYNGIRAFTAPTAKYNSATGRIDLAWHGSNSGSNGTAIFYMSFDPDVVTSYNTPMPYARIDATGDQYDPVLDHDPNGYTFISYLSNQDDGSNNSWYKHYGVAVAPWGYIYNPVAFDSTTMNPIMPGDYHGNFYWSSLDAFGARWLTVDAPWNTTTDYYLDVRWSNIQ